jgi:hypothetical protein
MKFKKLHHDAIEGLLYMLSNYTEHLHATTIQQRWLLLELNHLVQRLWLKREKMRMEGKTRSDLRLPERECYAFALLMKQHTLDTTNYTDNQVLKMLTDIYQTYNCTH